MVKTTSSSSSSKSNHNGSGSGAIAFSESLSSKRAKVWKLGIAAAGVSFAWVAVHFTAVHVYTYHCAPLTVSGFVRTVFIAPSPMCQVLRYGIQYGADHISKMWTSAITFMLSSVVVATAFVK